MIDRHFATPPTLEGDHQESDTESQDSSFGHRKVTTQEPEKAIPVSPQPSYGTDYYSHADEPEWNPSALISRSLPFPTTVPDEYRFREIERECYEMILEPDNLLSPSIPERSIRYRHDAYHEFARGYAGNDVIGTIQDGKLYSTDCREIKKLIGYSLPTADVYELPDGRTYGHFFCVMLGKLVDGSAFHFHGDDDREDANLDGTMIVAPDWKTLIAHLDDARLLQVAYSMSINNSDKLKALINPDRSGQLSCWLNDLGDFGKALGWIASNKEKVTRLRKNFMLLLN
ncbi:hypothetical protein [Endozoicomonas lisbonensis]|uniref:Uncharacterized protein n=1 Tax=Endozoicomonas lisbonensis TaxID=3120522 RepID=A0ABV2SKP8_9GAMM